MNEVNCALPSVGKRCVPAETVRTVIPEGSKGLIIQQKKIRLSVKTIALRNAIGSFSFLLKLINSSDLPRSGDEIDESGKEAFHAPQPRHPIEPSLELDGDNTCPCTNGGEIPRRFDSLLPNDLVGARLRIHLQ